jgi:hypothetical protein
LKTSCVSKRKAVVMAIPLSASRIVARSARRISVHPCPIRSRAAESGLAGPLGLGL